MNDDSHGKTFKTSHAKLYYSRHTWAMKLSQLAKQTGTVRIITYSLPRTDYIINLLSKRPGGSNIFLICHDKFRVQAKAIKFSLPRLRIATNLKVHSKIVLTEPETISVTSANFGESGWHETTVTFKAKDAHDAYVLNSFDVLWASSAEIT